MAALAIRDLPDGRRVVALDGRLDAGTVRSLWGEAHRALADAAGKPVTVDASAVEYCDNAGVALLVARLAAGWWRVSLPKGAPWRSRPRGSPFR